MPFSLRYFTHLRFLPVTISLLLIAVQPSFATMALPMDLSQMTRQAGKIFVARCNEVETDLDERGIPSTFARFTVLEGIKGVETGEQVLVKQFGVSRQPLSVGEGESAIVAMKTISVGSGSYRPGGDYLLFLYPESSLGFTSPVGAGQGRFEVGEGGPAGLRMAVNPLGNQFLKAFGNRPVDLETMVERVRSLMKP